MQKFLYHGSIVPKITELSANANSHDSERNILYLTDSFPYSLFYIWDSKHNLKQGKHVTCWIKNGIVYYEEQFENQLKRFYDGISGFVYVVKGSDEFRQVPDRESMWFSNNNVLVSEVIYVSNVFEEIQKYLSEGKIKIISYEQVDKKRIDDLYEHISNRIIKDNLLSSPECEDSLFYRTFFTKAWESAKNKLK